MRAWVWLAATVAVSSAASAYPISPRTLRAQMREAQLVVVAKVLPEDEGPFARLQRFVGKRLHRQSSVTLQVLETWKGAASGELSVSFNANMACPAPPRFAEGSTVLAFLEEERGVGWGVVGLSYGTLYPDADELPVLRRAARQILDLRPGDSTAENDLLVDLASRRATRWDGLFELVPEGDRLHDYYRREKPAGNASRLTAEQLARIAAGFVREPSTDQSLPMTLLLLAGFPDREFDRALVGVIDAMVERESLPYWFQDALKLAMSRLRPGEEPRELDPTALVVPENFRKLWEPFRARLELGGAIPKIDLPSRHGGGVGRHTPP